ncbi:secretin [Marinobacter salinisoli]|uniref:Secretin n=1 Tax=Marinobacter salinisoli TaxID=2769486 RepID=A0ABX7MS42_9GAMM|nr:secretin N-terminal domain-containing protein [Marinobacter salinisoli]QSP95200.1 secretin [Marinobacter salinisoli]
MTDYPYSCSRRRSLLATIATAMLVVICLTATGVHAQTDTRIYDVRNRSADDIANQIRDLYQDTPMTVTSRGQRLVVRAEAQLLEEVGTLVSVLDVAPVQLRITVRSREDIGGKRSGAGVSGSSDRVTVGVERRGTSTSSARQRTLVVQDGQSAHITSGQVRTLPFAIQGGRNPAAILEQVETRSGFLVSPQMISDQAIELSIMSFEEDPAALPGYDTEAVVTMRRVEPGQWVALGSTSTQSSNRQSGITYSVNGNRSQAMSYEVRVDILP